MPKNRAFYFLSKMLKPHHTILSYASFGDELDIWKLNRILAKQQKLALPFIHDHELFIYPVNDISQLKQNSFGVLEPDPNACDCISPEEISAVLVPGLAFGTNNHRLGYGKGYYDRFLKAITPSFGIGFLEQQMETELIAEPHDVPLSSVYLF